jgi:hypothetical protein
MHVRMHVCMYSSGAFMCVCIQVVPRVCQIDRRKLGPEPVVGNQEKWQEIARGLIATGVGQAAQHFGPRRRGGGSVILLRLILRLV